MLSHSWTTRKIFACSHASFIEASLSCWQKEVMHSQVYQYCCKLFSILCLFKNPTLQGSRAKYLKVKIKGDWEGKKSRERKFMWVDTISKLLPSKNQTKTKKDSQPAFWRFWLPRHLMERNISYRVFEKSGYQISGFLSLTRFPSCQICTRSKETAVFPPFIV